MTPRIAASPFLVVALAALAGPAAAGEKAAGGKRDDALRDELLRMVKEDQDARARSSRAASPTARRRRRWKQSTAATRCAAQGSRGQGRLARQVPRRGGRRPRRLAPRPARGQGPGLPEARLPVRCVEKAVKSGEATGQDLAYLTDRVRVGEGKKQLYGTQFQGAGDKMEPYPIEDEAGVDRRRKEVGLPTMAEYRKLLAETYKSKPAEKK